MQKLSITTPIYTALTLLCLIKIIIDICEQSVSFLTLEIWIGLIVILYFATKNILPKQKSSRNTQPITKKEKVVLLILGLETLISLWWFGTRPTHFHYDEFITAYTSYTLPIYRNINWFGVFPKPGEWVCQFPIFFHILQYPFVRMFPTVMAIRISTWPYTLGVVCLVYLITRLLTKRKNLALYAAIAFLFMAPQQYIGSMGLHFHTATFFFLMSIYFFMKTTDAPNPRNIFSLGVSVACCFLGYTAAYLIAPLLVALGCIRILTKPDKKLAISYITAFIIALLVLSPWITYAVRFNNFFLQRIGQINTFTGTWVEPKNMITLQNGLTMLPARTLTALSSFLMDQQSGVGEYFFGSMALLDLFSVMLLTAGIIHLFILSVQKKFHAFVLISSMVALFFTGTVFTQYPTPFHRLTIDFPFFGICIGLGIGVVQTMWNKYSNIRFPSCVSGIILCICFSLVNSFRAYVMIQKNIPLQNLDSLTLAQDVTSYVRSSNTVHIVASPEYHLGKELFFRLNGAIYFITNRTGYNIKLPRTQCIIVRNPTDITTLFIKDMYPNAVRLYHTFPLQSHAVFLNR